MFKKIIIVAASENGCIGEDGGMPCYYPEDLKHFKNCTINNTVIMGRKTFASIGRPLSHRQSIVLSTRKAGEDKALLKYKNYITVASSIKSALDCVSKHPRKCFIIGGSNVYEQFLPIVDEIWLTRIPGQFNGDCYFPEWPIRWECVERTFVPASELELVRYAR